MKPLYEYHGIAVYEIIDGGKRLSGTYLTTGGNPAIIGSDTAILLYGDLSTSAKYKVCAMDDNNTKLVDCELVITFNPNGYYEFVWDNYWKGIGLRAGNNHIGVSYSHPL